MKVHIDSNINLTKKIGNKQLKCISVCFYLVCSLWMGKCIEKTLMEKFFKFKLKIGLSVSVSSTSYIISAAG